MRLSAVRWAAFSNWSTDGMRRHLPPESGLPGVRRLNGSRMVGDSNRVRTLLQAMLVFAACAAHADISWDFAQDDPQPGGQGGVYAYLYPKDSASRQSPFHTASLQRIATSATTGAAKLSFVLDGKHYPSAGFGLMFPSSLPLDLNALKSVRLHLSTDKPRTVRISFASRLPAYQTASDTGMSYGRDMVVTSAGIDTAILASGFAWPNWALDAETPSVLPSAILGSTWAIQLNVSCEGAGGVCAKDTGWVRLDSIDLVGVGLTWPTPSAGSCTGDSLEFSRFSSSSPKLNGLGGWWYAFSDVSSSDTAALGFSKILSAPVPTNPTTWVPDSAGDAAYLGFDLVRGGSYSGYAALESQFGPPNASGIPVPATMPGLRAISFRLAYDSGFPSSLGGVTFHAKKAGVAYANGQDHQIRIPFDSAAHRWCLDFDSLQQPDWSAWGKLPFTPDSLLALTWEVNLQGDATEALGGFRISDISLWSTDVGVRPLVNPTWSLRRVGSDLEVIRPIGGGALSAELFDARGRLLENVQAGPDQTSIDLSVPSRSFAWVRLHDDRGWRTFPVPLAP